MGIAANSTFAASRRRFYASSNHSDPGTASTSLSLSALGEYSNSSPHQGAPMGSRNIPLSTDASANNSAKSIFDRGERKSGSAKDKRSLDVASLLAASSGWQTETDMHSMVVSLLACLRPSSGGL